MAYNYIVQSGETQIVSAGMTTVGVTVSSGGLQKVSKGGVALNTTIMGGYHYDDEVIGQAIYKGGIASNSIVYGEEHVFKGGKSISALVESSGDHYVFGTVSKAKVTGCQYVYSGGTTKKLNLTSGSLYIYSSGYASGITTTSSSHIGVGFNASADNIKLNGSPEHWAYNWGLTISGGIARTLVLKNSDMTVIGATSSSYDSSKDEYNYSYKNGECYNTTISGGSQTVSSGGRSYSTTITNGRQEIYSGGSAYSTTIISGNQAISGGFAKNTIISGYTGDYYYFRQSEIGAGGSAINTKLYNRVIQEIYTTGKAISTYIYNNASQYVNRGIAQKTYIYKGGTQSVADGGKTFDIIVNNGGKLVVDSAGEALHVIVKSGGQLEVLNDGIITNAIVDSGAKYTVEKGGRVTFLAKNTNVTTGLWTGETQNISSGTTKKNVGVFGTQNVLVGGTALSTSVNSGGVQNVQGVAKSTTITKGGTVNVSKGATISSFTVNTGGKLKLDASVALSGSNTVDGGNIIAGTKTTFAKLDTGATLTLGKNSNLSKLYLNTANANVVAKGVNNSIALLNMNNKTQVTYDVSNLSAGNKNFMLSLSTKNSQKLGSYTVKTAKNQDIGTYKLSNNLIQAKGLAFTVNQGKTKLGTAKVNSTSLTKNGMTYSLKYGSGQLNLSVSMKAGSMKKGTDKDDTLTGTANSDIFYAGKGNDSINGKNGRDVAVYDKTAWGKDVIAKTAGTMTILFNGLSAKDITKKTSGNNLVITMKSNKKQTITVKNWSDSTHNIVFGNNMTAFNKWLTKAKPTGTQTTAARNEVWKKAGLASA